MRENTPCAKIPSTILRHIGLCAGLSLDFNITLFIIKGGGGYSVRPETYEIFRNGDEKLFFIGSIVKITLNLPLLRCMLFADYSYNFHPPIVMKFGKHYFLV